MSRYQFFVLPLLVGGVFFLTGSAEPTAAPGLSTPGAKLAPPLAPWAGAAQALPPELAARKPGAVLDQAATRFGANNVAWLEMSFRQQVAYDDISFELNGRYLSAPGERFRYELNVSISGEASKTLVICDGASLTEIAEMPRKPRAVATQELPTILNPTDEPAAIAAARANLLATRSFSGIGTLLASVRAALVAPEMHAVKVNGRDYLEIRGKWAADVAAHEVAADVRLRALPRECRVYLDPATLWPACIEWWGSAAANGPAQLLVQTQYDLIRLNQALSSQEAEEVFRCTHAPATAKR